MRHELEAMRAAKIEGDNVQAPSVQTASTARGLS